MPYEDDYKMWLEKMLIESNPDWVCDGMYDKEITRNWCVDYCGEDDEYITPRCLHMYYHHIARADRKTENSSEIPNNSDTISRQAAISAICNACGKIDCDKMDKCEKLQLPPANCSEFPNNCEHITEDGVTCAKYPACGDCLDNPLNKVKGSKRLLKGKDEPTGYNLSPVDKDINVRSKIEPQTEGIWNAGYKTGYDKGYKDAQKVKDSQDLVKDLVKDEPQTDCSWK